MTCGTTYGYTIYGCTIYGHPLRMTCMDTLDEGGLLIFSLFSSLLCFWHPHPHPQDRHVKITDFGFATTKSNSTTANSSAQGTTGSTTAAQHGARHNAQVGTVPWMAPELFSGLGGGMGEALDVYAFAVRIRTGIWILANPLRRATPPPLFPALPHRQWRTLSAHLASIRPPQVVLWELAAWRAPFEELHEEEARTRGALPRGR